jgi:hypothetical protein
MAKERADNPSAHARNVFPATQHTWLVNELVNGGPTAFGRVNQHVMTVYAHPLKVYYLGSSWRSSGEPDDIVNGFFANRLSRETFLKDWQSSGLRLRRWLMNGLLFYLKENYRRQVRDGAVTPLPDEASGTWSGGPEAAFDRAWAESLVRAAWAMAQERCTASGQQTHWDLFIRHHLNGEPYRNLAEAFGVTPGRAAVMVRTSSGKFRSALREVIAADGVPDDEVDQELQQLMEVMS